MMIPFPKIDPITKSGKKEKDRKKHQSKHEYHSQKKTRKKYHDHDKSER